MKSQFVMNVGQICKSIPACLPHELLGYPLDSVEGTILTMDIVNKMNIEENELNNNPKKREANNRRSKFNKNK